MRSAKKPYFLYDILKSQGGIHDDDDCVDSQNEVVVVMEMKTGMKTCFQTVTNVDKTLRREDVET